MPDHSPAVIAAAKALAEKHGLPNVRACYIMALCEALITTPSEEDLMAFHRATPKSTPAEQAKAIEMARQMDADEAKPEPSEDHLRRACEELNVEAALIGRWGTVIGDYENPAVRTVARLLAERDAMQARVEAKPARVDEYHPILAEVLKVRRRAATDFSLTARKGNEADAYDDGVLDCYHQLEAFLKSASEPTPDPDLVLAREAAAQIDDDASNTATAADIRAGRLDYNGCVQSALRALKMKGQAHDQ